MPGGPAPKAHQWLQAHYAAKLTPAQILDIRAARARKVFATALARQYGVSSSAIYAIEQGKTWKQAA